jgi:hypothetical protein
MQKITRITERSLEHAAGVSYFIDERGARWGLRTFTLRHAGYFNEILFKAIAAAAGQPAASFVCRLAWSLFIQRCVCCHNPYMSVSIRARRLFGLPDYPLRKIWRLSRATAVREFGADGSLFIPEIVEPIIYATLDYKTFGELFEEKKDKGGAANWGEVAATFFIHKNLMPTAILDLTIPQLNAINEVLSKDRIRNARPPDEDKNRNVIDEILEMQRRTRKGVRR